MAGASAFVGTQDVCPRLYRPRNPRVSSLYQLLEHHYETVKELWEERFERRYGFWRGAWDGAVAKYLDCGLFESGFARVTCTRCPSEFLVAFSCKGRGLCPSCGAKRAAIFSELFQHQILVDVGHAQWVFSIPKMLRLYFLHHRELLGDIARLAYESVCEMMVAAVDEPSARPGMVAVIQTFGSSLQWNPHIHAIVSRGVWTPDGAWLPVPHVDAHRAELVFRHKLLARLRDRGLLSQERSELLLSWQHSGFSVHNHTTVYPSDTEGMHKLACYLMRAPVNLSRLRFDQPSGLLVYEPRAGQGVEDDALVDPLEFIARVLIHIPQLNKHLVHFYGAYANRVRAAYRRAHTNRRDDSSDEPPPPRRGVSKRWAELIHRIYEVDPLTCPRCGAPMKILAFIAEPQVIQKILDHRRNQHFSSPRAPPTPDQPPVH